MLRTTIIVVTVLALAFAFSWMMTRRLISTWQPERPATSVVAP